MSIHERIKMIRERFDLTQEEFGERISLSGPDNLDGGGKRQLSERTANDICRVFELTRNGSYMARGKCSRRGKHTSNTSSITS